MALGFLTGQGVTRREQVNPTPDEQEDELFEMSNLWPKNTGLPLTVWVSSRGGAQHDARVKVSLSPGKMDVTNTAVVAIRPRPRLIVGDLETGDLDSICRWIELNEQTLMEYWNQTIDSIELAQKLKKI